MSGFFILNWSSWCRIFYFEVTIWGSNWLMRGWWRQTSENHDVIILNHLIDTTKLTNERGHSFIGISFMHDEQFNLLWKFSSKRVSLDKWIHAVCIFQIIFFLSKVTFHEGNKIPLRILCVKEKNYRGCSLSGQCKMIVESSSLLEGEDKY